MENEPFHLSCLVEGYPKPNLTFFKDDEDEQQLLNELTRRGGGLYKIHASNGQQTVKSQINITVICKSLFKKQKHKQIPSLLNSLLCLVVCHHSV